MDNHQICGDINVSQMIISNVSGDSLIFVLAQMWGLWLGMKCFRQLVDGLPWNSAENLRNTKYRQSYWFVDWRFQASNCCHLTLFLMRGWSVGGYAFQRLCPDLIWLRIPRHAMVTIYQSQGSHSWNVLCFIVYVTLNRTEFAKWTTGQI